MFWSYGRWISLHANYLPTRFGIIYLTYAYRWHILQLLRQIWCERSLSKISSMIFECMSAILLYLWVELILYTVHVQNTSKSPNSQLPPTPNCMVLVQQIDIQKIILVHVLVSIYYWFSKTETHTLMAGQNQSLICRHTFLKQIMYTCLHTWPKWSLLTYL